MYYDTSYLYFVTILRSLSFVLVHLVCTVNWQCSMIMFNDLVTLRELLWLGRAPVSCVQLYSVQLYSTLHCVHCPYHCTPVARCMTHLYICFYWLFLLHCSIHIVLNFTFDLVYKIKPNLSVDHVPSIRNKK